LLCNDYIYSTETSSQLAGLYGYYSTIAQAEFAHRYPEQIRTLSVEELRYLASKYLSPYRYTVTVLKPE
jgi:zinc protease